MSLYHQLKRSGNPQAAVQTVISLLEKHSPKKVAEIMGVSVRWVYELRRRFRDSGGNLQVCILKRGPKSPMPNRTPLETEQLVVRLAQISNLGPHRLAVALQRSFGISLSPYTIRNILRRHGIRCRKKRSKNGSRRYYAADLSSFKPLEFFQFDTKHIADQNALPSEAYAALFKNKLPLYQFTAIDVKTRLRFISYAHSLSFENGLTFMLLVEAWLRAFGVNHHLFFQTDNGQEFGGTYNSRKRKLMQSLIFDRLGVSLLNIPPRQTMVNSYVERSHRTDDEEFYAIDLNLNTSLKSFLVLAQNWICKYNYQRPHFGSNMQGKSPMEALKHYKATYHPAIGAMPVIILDYASLYISTLFDITSIPWDNSPKNKLVNETMAQYISEITAFNGVSFN
ncbi:integrase core domain-containing protein [Calderihabitans maritimus]|uniref:Integrase catalytic subunit n=1 Tax=Calderihabitans maritimus TaxID=1246530 RepID=A0A1Z5HXU1_9FIRM|nr:integrase core domain-containing protein [Calderihabitans maritimus]GAW94343.1 integrase catalytic subunit [Calderihabitans maritimus]